MLEKIKQKNNLILYKIKSKILRNIFKIFKLRTSFNYFITSDGFRNIADHIYDDISTVNPEKIKEGEIVYIDNSEIFKYFKDVHPLIKNKYKIITGNADEPVGEKESKMIDEKIIRWFAQNNIYRHPKITPLPIGIENKRFNRTGQELIKAFGRKNIKNKINKIIFGFKVYNNTKERSEAIENLRQCPFADEIKQVICPKDYFKIIDTYKFIASPPGHGEDCYRTWEALYLGITPIVKKSICMDYFKSLGLPILILPDYNYNQIKIDEVNLKKNMELLSIEYWIKMIKESI